MNLAPADAAVVTYGDTGSGGGRAQSAGILNHRVHCAERTQGTIIAEFDGRALFYFYSRDTLNPTIFTELDTFATHAETAVCMDALQNKNFDR